MLVCNLVLSHLDYGNGLLFGTCDNFIKKIPACSKLCGENFLKEYLKFSSIDALHKIHWLLIKAHTNFKILLMVFKCFRDSDSPAYLKNLFLHTKRSVMYDNLRSNDGKLLIVPYVKYKMLQFQHLVLVIQ